LTQRDAGSLYLPLPGRFDEMAGPDGRPRTHWRDVAGTFSALDGESARRLTGAADRMLTSEGAGSVGPGDHGKHGDHTREHRLTLDPIPLMLTSQDWDVLERGLAQRTTLLEMILADVYGPQRLLRDGTIPAELVFASTRFRSACVTDNSGTGFLTGAGYLTVTGAELVRDAGGTWRVLRDVTDAPRGLGTALLIRRVAARLLPELHRRLAVVSLDGAVAHLRTALAAAVPPGSQSSRVVVLTGPGNVAAVLDHAYAATQLGYNVVESGDLAVRGGRVWIRSVEGLEPVDVILRTIGDDGADPLELPQTNSTDAWVPDQSCPSGIPGLVQAARQGHVAIANRLGSGFGEDPALTALLPQLCEHLLGEPLLLAGVEGLLAGVEGLSGGDRAPVDTATAPVLRDGIVGHGAVVLSAYTVGSGADRRMVATAHVRDASATSPVLKDVWVEGHSRMAPVVVTQSLPRVDLRSSLPSRAGEALYWIGRNSERAEMATNVALAVLARFETDPSLVELGAGQWLNRSLAALRAVSGAPSLDAGSRDPGTHERGVAGDQVRPVDRLRHELCGAIGMRPGALASSLDAVADAAGSVRGYLSSRTWRVTAGLRVESETLAANSDGIDLTAVGESMDRVVVALSALAGLANESTVRGPSWRLMDLGRRLERVLLTLGLVEATVAETVSDDVLQPLCELVLESCESLVAYRRRYRSDVVLDDVTEMVLRDRGNPRAVAFQIDRMAEHLDALAPQHHQLRDAVYLASDGVQSTHSVRATVLAVRGAVLPLGNRIVETFFAPVQPIRSTYRR
jgi:uncharacterized circularly permuted ATP-grasp superfamily protein/uncharacterized alpha-E superfamily protein